MVPSCDGNDTEDGTGKRRAQCYVSKSTMSEGLTRLYLGLCHGEKAARERCGRDADKPGWFDHPGRDQELWIFVSCTCHVLTYGVQRQPLGSLRGAFPEGIS